MFGILELLGLATLAQAFAPAGEAEGEPFRSAAAQSPAPAPADDGASATETAPQDSLGWEALYGDEAEDSDAPPLISADGAAAPVLEGFDPGDDRLVILYDPRAGADPSVAIETVADADGNLFDLVRLDGEAVARLPRVPDTPPLTTESLALVPDSEFAGGEDASA
ncbi:MAG: hypothetical protein D6757_02540 [Alphaproteobacteria bacterium]|nr:MAG: hypothetical protein D6757_02540 [Alphaproteobacteria bacterium]